MTVTGGKRRLTGMRIQWNPEKPEMVGNPAARRTLGRPMRSPWRL